MKLSTKGRYGLRAMLELALNASENEVTISKISKNQEISENYLEQILITLKKVGLVKSTKGYRGGFLLAKHPNDITVGEILIALEGSFAIVECTNKSSLSTCTRVDLCATKLVWEQINNCINSVIFSITLKDLVDNHNKLVSI